MDARARHDDLHRHRPDATAVGRAVGDRRFERVAIGRLAGVTIPLAVAVAIGGHRDIDVLHGRPHPDRRGIDRVGRPWCLAASGPRPPRRVR